MAKLIQNIALLFLFSALLISSSVARSPIATPEDGSTTSLPPATFSEEDVSDVKALIALPTDALPDSNSIDSNPVESVSGLEKIQLAMPIGDGLRPITRRFERMRAFRCRHGHRGGRFGGGHRRGQLHGEIDPARLGGGPGGDDEGRLGGQPGGDDEGRLGGQPGGDEEARMIGEFKEPHFFFRHHHHHHHHDEEEEEHHHDHHGEEVEHHHDHHGEDEEEHHHRHHFHHGEEEEEHHHRHRRGHGFWKVMRKFLGHY